MRAPCCPDCPYSFVTPAKRRWYDWLLFLVLVRRFHCRECDRRFVGSAIPVG